MPKDRLIMEDGQEVKRALPNIEVMGKQIIVPNKFYKRTKFSKNKEIDPLDLVLEEGYK